jgi:hypothetical protein
VRTPYDWSTETDDDDEIEGVDWHTTVALIIAAMAIVALTLIGR